MEVKLHVLFGSQEVISFRLSAENLPPLSAMGDNGCPGCCNIDDGRLDFNKSIDGKEG